jgi:hypothetical protein
MARRPALCDKVQPASGMMRRAAALIPPPFELDAWTRWRIVKSSAFNLFPYLRGAIAAHCRLGVPRLRAEIIPAEPGPGHAG